MKVILLEKIGKLGEVGDTAVVKAGYARNFLFPNGKAIPATKENLNDFEQRRTELMAAHDARVAEARKRAVGVDGVALRIEVNASDEGKLYGSVGTRDIADAINARTGSEISKSEVLLPHGVIRQLGEYEIALDLGHDVQAIVSLAVVDSKSAARVSDDGTIGDVEEETQDAAAEATDDAADSAVTTDADEGHDPEQAESHPD